jgi:CheY-like chemotaxis protein
MSDFGVARHRFRIADDAAFSMEYVLAALAADVGGGFQTELMVGNVDHDGTYMEKKRVLLIDDNDTFRRVLRATMEGMGYDVIEVTNGREAIAVFPVEGVDLVITDLLMPEKDGFEFIRYLRRRAPGVPVIAMSGGGRVGSGLYLEVAEQLGARSMLSKPFSKGDLENAIAATLSDEQP